MVRFDTRDKKPKIWNIAVLTVVTAVVIAILLCIKPTPDIAIGVVLCVYLALTVILLLAAFVMQLQYNPYSYNTIYYIGFALFLLSALISVIVITNAARKYNFEGNVALSNMVGVLTSSAKNYMLFSFPFIFLFSVWLCLSNISLIRHEGKRPVNFLGILLSILLLGGEIFLYRSDYYVMGSEREVMFHDLFTNLFAAFYLYFECMLIGTIIANLIVIRYEPEKNKDFLIILGCGLRKDGTPMPLLAGRIDRALKFYNDQIAETGKAPVFVPSGGQGADEVISESQSMKNYLMAKGVPEEHILMEDKSTSTYENMLFSKKVIGDANPQGKVVFSTTNYHVFRSGLMARRVKMRALGIGAKTRWYFWPNAYVREFVGLLTEHRLKQGLILGGMIVLYIVSTILNYKI